MRLEQRLYRVGGGHGFKQATENILNKDKKEVGKSLVEKIKTLLKNKKKEKVYSEAFEDGVNYAIGKLFSRKYINPKNITRVRRNSINSVDNSGKGFYEKVKSMQPKTNTIADIDAIPLARLKNL
jgi:hypothetical protein